MGEKIALATELARARKLLAQLIDFGSGPHVTVAEPGA